MTIGRIQPSQLVAFHQEKVTRNTALNYSEEMEKAKSPYINVEKRKDGKFNVISGFKYIDGIRLLNKNFPLLVVISDPYPSEQERKLALLQRCLSNNEKNKYKEILIYELIKNYKMNEFSISQELGQDANKIKKYMYRQIIPHTYLEEAEHLGVKHIIQAIFLANSYTLHEKRILTELCLEPNYHLRLKNKHLALYRKYRRTYSLFEDFSMAKQQVLSAVNPDKAIEEYWEKIAHPLVYTDIHIFDQSRPAH
ncbi:hypothetical protein [Aquibacillus sediminis]|uniref:hypothetical protein n=1 Tax=Aquibacillus sediminis TaxID=2574734 RepID=UPI001109AA1E|nr:hypothetical protein [Aquibacillus sediminis]